MAKGASAKRKTMRQRAAGQDEKRRRGAQRGWLVVTETSRGLGLSEDSFGLRALFPTMAPEVFMGSYFRQCAVVCHAPAARVDELVSRSMGGLDVPSLLEATASDSVFVWVASTAPSAPLKSIEMPDASAAAALHAAGHSTYCRAPPGVEASLVGSLARETGLGLGLYRPPGQAGMHDLARGEVEVFCGRKGHVTDWHFDFQENFTVQLSGAKRWLLSWSPIHHPLRAHSPHFQAPDVVEGQLKAARIGRPQAMDFQFRPPPYLSHSVATGGGDHPEVLEVVLSAGDSFYFPAGMWHRVETIEDGVSMNVSLMAQTWAEFVTSGVRHALWNRSPSTCVGQDWKALVCDYPAVPALSAHASLETLLSDLKAAVNTLTVEDLLPPCLKRDHAGSMVRLEQERQEQPGREGVEEEEEEDGEEGGEDEEEDDDEDDESGRRRVQVSIMDVQLDEKHPSADRAYRLNPLAVLIHRDDIEEFYAGREPAGSKDTSETWSLHVNFGNDGMESMVEVDLICAQRISQAIRCIQAWLVRESEELNAITASAEQQDSSCSALGAFLSLEPGERGTLLRALCHFGFLVPSTSSE